MIQKIKGALFDLDGTLTDTELIQYEGWVEALKPYDCILTKKDYLGYVGKSGEYIAEELVRKFNLKITPKELIGRKKRNAEEFLEKNEIKLMPYAKEAVECFMEKGCKVGVVTGGRRDELEIKLRKSGLMRYFDVRISADDVKNGKPFPDVYIEALKRLGLEARETIAFEDTEFGVLSAKAAGIKCFAIPTELSAKQDFSKADGIFSNLKEACVKMPWD